MRRFGMQPGNRGSSLTATTETPSRGGRLDIALARASDAPLREGNRLRLLKDGPNTYEDWLAEITRAERWVHLENYIFEAVNPPMLGTPLGVVRRDHRKLLAVDGTYASTGGVCISEGWLVTSPETGLPYRDTAVSVRGPAVADLDHAFAGTWAEAGQPLPDEECPSAEHIPAAGEESVRIVVQEPRRMRTLRMLQLLTAS